jgi:hypothetical protein
VVDERLVPTKLIVLEMSDDDIIKRVQSLPEDQISKTHLNEKKIKNLLKRYRDLNNAETGDFVLEDFFKENKTPCHHVMISSQTDAIL